MEEASSGIAFTTPTDVEQRNSGGDVHGEATGEGNTIVSECPTTISLVSIYREEESPGIARPGCFFMSSSSSFTSSWTEGREEKGDGGESRMCCSACHTSAATMAVLHASRGRFMVTPFAIFSFLSGDVFFSSSSGWEGKRNADDDKEGEDSSASFVPPARGGGGSQSIRCNGRTTVHGDALQGNDLKKVTCRSTGVRWLFPLLPGGTAVHPSSCSRASCISPWAVIVAKVKCNVCHHSDGNGWWRTAACSSAERRPDGRSQADGGSTGAGEAAVVSHGCHAASLSSSSSWRSAWTVVCRRC